MTIKDLYELHDDEAILKFHELAVQFKQTEMYDLLKLANEYEIKRLLTTGRMTSERAEYRIGKMEGIQDAFENRVEAIIREGEALIAGKKAELEDEELDDDGNIKKKEKK